MAKFFGGVSRCLVNRNLVFYTHEVTRTMMGDIFILICHYWFYKWLVMILDLTFCSSSLKKVGSDSDCLDGVPYLRMIVWVYSIWSHHVMGRARHIIVIIKPGFLWKMVALIAVWLPPCGGGVACTSLCGHVTRFGCWVGIRLGWNSPNRGHDAIGTPLYFVKELTT